MTTTDALLITAACSFSVLFYFSPSICLLWSVGSTDVDFAFDAFCHFHSGSWDAMCFLISFLFGLRLDTRERTRLEFILFFSQDLSFDY